MERIKTINREIDKFGPGKDGFRAAIPGVSEPTYLSAIFVESLQEAIMRVQEMAGMQPSADHNQFANAISYLIDYAVHRLAKLVGQTRSDTEVMASQPFLGLSNLSFASLLASQMMEPMVQGPIKLPAFNRQQALVATQGGGSPN